MFVLTICLSTFFQSWDVAGSLLFEIIFEIFSLYSLFFGSHLKIFSSHFFLRYFSSHFFRGFFCLILLGFLFPAYFFFRFSLFLLILRDLFLSFHFFLFFFCSLLLDIFFFLLLTSRFPSRTFEALFPQQSSSLESFLETQIKNQRKKQLFNRVFNKIFCNIVLR